MKKFGFKANDLIPLRAEPFGWTIPVVVTASTYCEVFTPKRRRRETLDDRMLLVFDALKKALARKGKVKLCPFYVGPTPLRDMGYIMVAVLCCDKEGNRQCLLSLMDEGTKLARQIGKTWYL